MAMTTRRGKGSELTWDEGDDNFERVGIVAEKMKLQSPNVKLAGCRTITFTNGSATVIGTNFLDNSSNGLSQGTECFVLVNDVFYNISINSIQSDTSAEIYEVAEIVVLGEQYNVLDTVWPFASGEYQVFRHINLYDVSWDTIAIGNRIQKVGTYDNENFNVLIGQSLYVNEGSYNTLIGANHQAKSSTNVLVGLYNKLNLDNPGKGENVMIGNNNTIESVGGGLKLGSIIIGFNNQISENSNNSRNHIIGEANNINCNGSLNMILNCFSTTLGGVNSTINSVTAIGFQQEQLDFAVLTNCVVVPRLLVYEIPVFEDDAAAGVGGLIAGMAYRNAAGQAFYKLP